jgi:lysophospholipase L1-like esterase
MVTEIKRVPSKPSWRVRVLLVAGSLFFCLLFAEIVLRLFWTPIRFQGDRMFGRHPDYGIAPLALAKGRDVSVEYDKTFEHTAQRLRGSRLVRAERDEHTRARVLLLGDSFTYGLGCNNDETFASRLSARWPDVEIINAGSNGYGQLEELAVLDLLGGATKPDLAVIMFFWNDLENSGRKNAPRYELASDGHIRRIKPARPPGDPLQLWPEERRALHWPWRTTFVYEVCKQATDAVRYRWLGIRPRRIRDEAQKEAAWKRTEPLFALLKRRADEIGVRLVCVCVPDHNQVNPKAVIRNIGPVNFEVQQRLQKVCEQNGILYFDPLPYFRSTFAKRNAADPPLYYYVNRHLTPAGNVVMADFLADVLSPLLPSKKSSNPAGTARQ